MALPIVVLLIIPIALVSLTGDLNPPLTLPFPANTVTLTFASSVLFLGMSLILKANKLFSTIGAGTLAPWDPPRKVITCSIYAHVRNPMITGVLLVLLAETVMFGSLVLLIWLLVFWLGNHIYFVVYEEPDLRDRFGDDYVRYSENVPRWIPRRDPWKPSNAEND